MFQTAFLSEKIPLVNSHIPMVSQLTHDITIVLGFDPMKSPYLRLPRDEMSVWTLSNRHFSLQHEVPSKYPWVTSNMILQL